jgi:ABC-type Fe3+/spermidine/putrescine transport system ATPase subunit
MTAVSLVDLSKDYGSGNAAVRGLSLEIRSGELVALLGPSGCGKTTTLKMIAGLIHPSAGDIAFDSVSVLGTPPERRGAVMVFQNHLLFPYMSVADNVAFGLRMRRVPAPERARRVAEALASVHLQGFENRRPADLSGGQQQRVALARALVTKPRLLLLDEPLSNLDAHLRLEMRNLIRNLQRESEITVIFVTHDQQEAVILSDRTALIFDGVLQQFGAPRDFYERPVSERVARFFGAENFISGEKSADRVATPIGNLRVGEGSGEDGPVLLAVRPESIELGTRGPNCVRGVIESALYTGIGTEILVKIDSVRLKVHAAAELQPRPGAAIEVTLPQEKIIVLRKDAPSHPKEGTPP